MLTARAAHSMSQKPVFLNAGDVPIGSAATWDDVADLVSKRVGAISAEAMQRQASEGPLGFYVTLRLQTVAGRGGSED
jgi:hypothetical protein